MISCVDADKFDCAFSGHFLVDMWARGVFGDLIEVTEPGKGEGAAGNELSSAEEKMALGDLLSVSTVGPALWSEATQGYYELPQPANVAEDFTVAQPAAFVLNRRRVNQVTSKGRMSATVLYQELSKPAVDEHRLVAPYDYGEQFGAAENLSQPYRICVHPQVGLLCDVHGHLCDAEVIGLLAGKWDAVKKVLYIQAPFPCSATERHFDLGHTDVELDSEAEWKVREAIADLNLEVVGWYHSHPKFRPDPSVVDILNQQQYQCFTSNEEQGNPFVGLIVSTYDPQLPTPVANHQWFTVVPYSPGSSADEPSAASNFTNTVDLPGKAEAAEETVATASKAAGTPHPVLYMPVRMEVEYYNVSLDRTPNSLISSGIPTEALSTGFASQDSDYAQGLLEALRALRLDSPGGTPGRGKNSSSLVRDGVAALARANEDEENEDGVMMGSDSAKASGKGSSKSTGSPRAKRSKGAHTKEAAVPPAQETPAPPQATSEDGYWSSSPSVTPTPMMAVEPESSQPPVQTRARPHLPAVSSVSSISRIPQGLDALTIEEGTGSWASNSLAGSASVSESGEDGKGRRGRAAKGTKKSAKVTLQLPGTVTPAEEAALLAGASAVSTASASGNDSSRASTTADSSEPTIVTPKDEGAQGADARDIEADHELAVKLAAQEGERRRPSRTPKGRQHFGDFVDPLTALDGHMLRKQNVAKVVAQEKKEKLLAKRAKDSNGNGEGEGEGKKKRGRAAVKKEGEGGMPLPVGVAAAASDASGVPPKGKKRTKGCKTCKPVDLLASPLCAPSSSGANGESGKPMTKKRSQASIKSETSSASANTSDTTKVETVHTSVLLALQDPTLRSSQLARQMLCTVVPQYRGLVLTLISMGMYYGRSPRRSDLSKAWRSLTRLAKVKTSASVWCARLGLQPGGVATLQSADGSVEPRMLTKAALAEAIDQTEQYLLIEWLGVFLTACWEDYAARSRKRKNAA